MSSFIHSIQKLIKKHKVWCVVGVAVLLIGGTAFAMGGSGVEETVSPKHADLVRTVRISGKAIPKEKVNLAFEISGTVVFSGKEVGSSVSKGETLAQLDRGAKSAEVKQAEADLASAEAEYARIEGGKGYETTLSSAQRSLAQTLKDTYTVASDAVNNKTDQFFIDPHGSRPEVAGTFSGNSELHDILRTERVNLEYTLDAWRQMVTKMSPNTYSEAELTRTKEYLAQVSTFVRDASRAVNLFEANNFMTQSEIDSYKAAAFAARENIDTASQNLIAGEKSLSGTLSSLPVQLAKVEAAQAVVTKLRYELGRAALVSPISGIVSRQDAKVGQSVSAGSLVASVISAEYLVEAFVPEVSIAGIKEGNAATITFDAYGPEQSFAARVERIDPAETIKDGVSTYRVELAFNTPDARIRSGLTSNVSIETLRKSEALLLPERAVTREGSEAYVYVIENNERRRVLVSVGERDSEGNVEILSGLSGEEKLALNPRAK